jgi:hypothetical protein
MTWRQAVRWFIGLPVAIIGVAFAVANRQWITVSLDPTSRDNPFISIDMPLWALFFCGTFAGLIAGWIACWLAQAKWRRSAKSARAELAKLQAEAAHHQRESERKSEALMPVGEF